MKSVSITASLFRITTTTDGGWRISFDVPQSENQQVMQLSEFRNLLLQIGIVVVPPIEDLEDR